MKKYCSNCYVPPMGKNYHYVSKKECKCGCHKSKMINPLSIYVEQDSYGNKRILGGGNVQDILIDKINEIVGCLNDLEKYLKKTK